MLLGIIVAVLLSDVGWGITRGRSAPYYPFFAVVNRGSHQCGGTLLRLDAVLTAAHCLYFETEKRWATPLEVYVLHGDFSKPDNWQIRYHSCEKIIIHYKYEVASQQIRSSFNAAIIKLEDRVHTRGSSQRRVLPVCRFDGERWRRNIFGVAIGLGLINVNPIVRPARLMQTSLQMTDCHNNNFSGQQINFSAQQCYSLLRGLTLAKGDFGGPMVVQDRGRASCLLGASSCTVYSHTNDLFTTVFTPAGNMRYWLNKVFRDNFTNNFQT